MNSHNKYLAFSPIPTLASSRVQSSLSQDKFDTTTYNQSTTFNYGSSLENLLGYQTPQTTPRSIHNSGQYFPYKYTHQSQLQKMGHILQKKLRQRLSDAYKQLSEIQYKNIKKQTNRSLEIKNINYKQQQQIDQNQQMIICGTSNNCRMHPLTKIKSNIALEDTKLQQNNKNLTYQHKSCVIKTNIQEYASYSEYYIIQNIPQKLAPIAINNVYQLHEQQQKNKGNTPNTKKYEQIAIVKETMRNINLCTPKNKPEKFIFK